MNRTNDGRFAQARDSINNERATADQDIGAMPSFTEMFAGVDVLGVVCKVAIGYVYFVLGFIAFDHIAYMLMMLTNVVWLQYIIAFAVLAAGIYFLLKTAPAIATATYDAIDYVVGKTKSLFDGFEMPKFAMPSFGTKTESTVH